MQECRNTKKSKRTHFLLGAGGWSLGAVLSKRTQFPHFSANFKGHQNPYTCIPVYLFSQNEPNFLQCLQFYSLSVQWCHGQYES